MEYVSILLTLNESFFYRPCLLIILSGFGGMVSPLISQTLIAAGVPWRHFYLGSLVLSASNIAFLVLTHRPTSNEYLRDREAVLRKEASKVDDKLSNYDKLEKQGSCPSLPKSNGTSTEKDKSVPRNFFSRALADFVVSPCSGSAPAVPMGRGLVRIPLLRLVRLTSSRLFSVYAYFGSVRP